MASFSIDVNGTVIPIGLISSYTAGARAASSILDNYKRDKLQEEKGGEREGDNTLFLGHGFDRGND